MSEPSDDSRQTPAAELSPAAAPAAAWFTQQVTACFPHNLVHVTVYGPVVTPIFSLRAHRIHFLIVTLRHDVEQLLRLAKVSRRAVRRRISPPLVIAEESFRQSLDVFPLEWLEISRFHRTLQGDFVLEPTSLKPSLLRLQCERDLRSLDILLQRGVLASGGRPRRIQRLESHASDTLIRIMGGINWLAGDRRWLLPTECCAACETVVATKLTGCAQVIRADERPDVRAVTQLLDEINYLSNWVNNLQLAHE